jgi:hypothetical protein
MMHGDGRVDQIASERPQPRQNPVLVGSGKPRKSDDVGYQDRREFPCLAHGASAEAKSPLADGMGMVRFHAALTEGVEAESASLRVGPRNLSTPC